jgi:hypothetical protein
VPHPVGFLSKKESGCGLWSAPTCRRCPRRGDWAQPCPPPLGWGWKGGPQARGRAGVPAQLAMGGAIWGGELRAQTLTPPEGFPLFAPAAHHRPPFHPRLPIGTQDPGQQKKPAPSGIASPHDAGVSCWPAQDLHAIQLLAPSLTRSVPKTIIIMSGTGGAICLPM